MKKQKTINDISGRDDYLFGDKLLNHKESESLLNKVSITNLIIKPYNVTNEGLYYYEGTINLLDKDGWELTSDDFNFLEKRDDLTEQEIAFLVLYLESTAILRRNNID